MNYKNQVGRPRLVLHTANRVCETENNRRDLGLLSDKAFQSASGGTCTSCSSSKSQVSATQCSQQSNAVACLELIWYSKRIRHSQTGRYCLAGAKQNADWAGRKRTDRTHLILDERQIEVCLRAPNILQQILQPEWFEFT